MENYLKRTNSFFRFLLVGVVNTLIGLSIMLLLLNAAEMSYWISTFIGNGVGAFVSYFLNRSFTFQSKIHLKTSIPRFIIVILSCYIFSYSVSHMALRIFEEGNSLLAENLAVVIGAGLYTLLNYLGQRFYVFKNMEAV
ncbi:GtrA family protein [Bacillus sp. JJ1773]